METPDFTKNSSKGQYYKRKRQSTVEPVIGVLTQFMGMRKVYTKGIHNANKQFIMAAIAYNLKKYLKFEYRRIQTATKQVKSTLEGLFNAITQLLEQYMIKPLEPVEI